MIFFYCFEKVGKPIQMLATGWSYQKKCLHLTNVKGLPRLKNQILGTSCGWFCFGAVTLHRPFLQAGVVWAKK